MHEYLFPDNSVQLLPENIHHLAVERKSFYRTMQLSYRSRPRDRPINNDSIKSTKIKLGLKCKAISLRQDDSPLVLEQKQSDSNRKGLPKIGQKRGSQETNLKQIKSVRDKKYETIEKYQTKLLNIRFFNPEEHPKKIKLDPQTERIGSGFVLNMGASPRNPERTTEIMPSSFIEITNYKNMMGDISKVSRRSRMDEGK